MLYEYPKCFIVPVTYIADINDEPMEIINSLKSEFRKRNNEDLLEIFLQEESSEEDNFNYSDVDDEYAENETDKN